VVDGLGDGGFQRRCGIEHPEAAVGKAAAVGVEVGEGGHDDARSRAADPFAGGNQTDLAHLVSQPGIGHGFQFEDRIEIFRCGDPLEQ
jgi:hypothetical protein